MAWFGRLAFVCVALVSTVALAEPPRLQRVGRLDSPTPREGAGFSRAVAVDGRWAVVADQFERIGPSRPVGAAHVYELREGVWQHVTRLESPDTVAGNWFGASVDVSGDTIVVGNDGRNCEAGTGCGAVYVFVLRDGTWQFDTRVDSSLPARNDNFGELLALEGDTLAVSSRGDRAPARDAGMVEVFARESGVFRHQATIQPAGLPLRSRFGESLALEGDTLLIGAPREPIVGASNGAAYVMRRSEAGWSQEAKLSDSAELYFGSHVAIAGDLLFATTSSDRDDDRAERGSVRMFTRASGELRELPKLVHADPRPGGSFGPILAVSGDRLLVYGSYDSEDGLDLSTVHVFALEGERVTWLEELVPPGEPAEDLFGGELAISGRYALVAASDDSLLARNAGTVHLYYDARQERGSACSDEGECQSGQCVDGVCCESACGGDANDCVACRGELTGASDGTCAPMPSGSACGDSTTGSCSEPDTCDGAGLCEPHHAADGIPCEDGLFCTADDACAAGACMPGALLVCPGAQECVEAEAACSSVCGNGVLQQGEECDDGAANSDSAADACRSSCVLARCGDGVVDAAEGCDDGANNADDVTGACRTTCALASCGDGTLDPGETCDDGAANDDTRSDACRTTCVLAACGDGVVDEGEVCDEGAANSDVEPDRCRNTCAAPRCGDGVVDEGEGCDEGAATATCSVTCEVPVCAGAACDDAGAEDAGTPDVTDAGTPREPDAGAPAADAGDSAGDDDSTQPGGCTLAPLAQRAGFAPLALFGAALLLRRRTTRRRNAKVSLSRAHGQSPLR